MSKCEYLWMTAPESQKITIYKQEYEALRSARILYTQFTVYFSFIMQLTAMNRSVWRWLRPSAGHPQ